MTLADIIQFLVTFGLGYYFFVHHGKTGAKV